MILIQSLIEPSSIELYTELIMKKKFALIISLIVGIMKIVGSPHVYETFMGLVLAIGNGLWINNKTSPWNFLKE